VKNLPVLDPLPAGVEPVRDTAGGTLVICRHATRKPIRSTFGRTLNICPVCKTTGPEPVQMLVALLSVDEQGALF
jgi:hypothetical protein